MVFSCPVQVGLNSHPQNELNKINTQYLQCSKWCKDVLDVLFYQYKLTATANIKRGKCII